MSSPLLIKKARVSLKSNISDFLDSDEIVSNQKPDSQISFDYEPEDIDSHQDSCSIKRISPIDIKDEYTEYTCERIEKLRSKYADYQFLAKNLASERFFKRIPNHLEQCPEFYKPSKFFQKQAFHQSKDLAAFSLENQIAISNFSTNIKKSSEYWPSKSQISSVSFGGDQLKDFIIFGDLSSKLNIIDINYKKSFSRSLNLPKQSNSTRTQTSSYLILAGMAHGSITVFDIRMKNALHQLIQNPNMTDSFNPISNIELREHILLASSPNSISIWDLRTNMIMFEYSEQNAKIQKACLLDISSLNIGCCFDDKIKLISPTKNYMNILSLGNQIEDIVYVPKYEEFLTLVQKNSKENEFIKRQALVYKKTDQSLEILDKIDMTESYEHLSYRHSDDSLYSIGAKYFSVWKFCQEEEQENLKKLFQTSLI